VRISLYLLAVLFAAACGEVKGAQLDAKPADAKAPDAPDADLTGMATVITQTHFGGGTGVGTLLGNVDVVSVLPNGMVHDQGKTDSSGHMSIKVYPGGSVTAIYRHTADTGADLVTFLGAKPSDTLTFGKYWQPPSGNTLGAMTMSWPAVSGATAYQIGIPCGVYYVGNVTSYASFNEYPQCDREPMGVIGVAANSTGQVVAMSYTFITFTANSNQPLTTFWQTASSATATVTGLPPEVTNASESFSIVTNNGTQNYSFGTSAAPTGGAVTFTFPWVNTGERSVSQLQLQRGYSYATTSIFDALNSLTVTVANPDLPPWLTADPFIGFYPEVLANAAARKVEWLPAGPTNHTGNVVITSWSHTIGGTPTPFTWTFITPPDVTSFDLPKLPAIFDDAQPHPEDAMSALQTAALQIPSITNGYDGLRALPEAELTCPACAVRLNLIPRVIVSGYLPQAPF
jgi:hypothetical protein